MVLIHLGLDPIPVLGQNDVMNILYHIQPILVHSNSPNPSRNEIYTYLTTFLTFMEASKICVICHYVKRLEMVNLLNKNGICLGLF